MQYAKSLSRVRPLATPWLQESLRLKSLSTIACQVPLSRGFSRQERWSGLPFPTPGDLLHPGIKPLSPTSPTLTGEFFTTSTIWEAQCGHSSYL